MATPQTVDEGAVEPNVDHSRGVADIIALARSIRVGESLLMLGFPAVAAILVVQSDTPGWFPSIVSDLFGLAWISLSVYAYNSLAGWDTDREDPKFADRSMEGASHRPLVMATVVCLVLGLAVFVVWHPEHVLAAAGLWFVWFVYSHPAGLKRRPIAGTASHVVGGVLMAWIPATSQGPFTATGVVVVVALTAAFAAGHLTHEGIDREADETSGARTTAIVLGSANTHRAALAVASIGPTTVGVGWLSGALAPMVAAPLVAAGFLHVGLGLGLAFGSPDRDQLIAYRRHYRFAFAAGSAIACIAHILSM